MVCIKTSYSNVLLNLNDIKLHITTLWSFMNKKVYLMEVCPNPDHIILKLGQWFCEQPLKVARGLVQASGRSCVTHGQTEEQTEGQTEEQTEGQTDKQIDRHYMKYSKDVHILRICK